MSQRAQQRFGAAQTGSSLGEQIERKLNARLFEEKPVGARPAVKRSVHIIRAEQIDRGPVKGGQRVRIAPCTCQQMAKIGGSPPTVKRQVAGAQPSVDAAQRDFGGDRVIQMGLRQGDGQVNAGQTSHDLAVVLAGRVANRAAKSARAVRLSASASVCRSW